jgi:hypothetical protein
MLQFIQNIAGHLYLLEKRTPVDSKITPPAPGDKFIFKYWIPD